MVSVCLLGSIIHAHAKPEKLKLSRRYNWNLKLSPKGSIIITQADNHINGQNCNDTVMCSCSIFCCTYPKALLSESKWLRFNSGKYNGRRWLKISLPFCQHVHCLIFPPWNTAATTTEVCNFSGANMDIAQVK
jgi:hypothetical protein